MGESHRISLDMLGFVKKTETEFCTESNCNEATRHGKPFCPEHVLNLPYAAKIAALVADRQLAGIKDEADPFGEPRKKRQPSAGRTYPPIFRR